jgi:hypothetical protein
MLFGEKFIKFQVNLLNWCFNILCGEKDLTIFIIGHFSFINQFMKRYNIGITYLGHDGPR